MTKRDKLTKKLLAGGAFKWKELATLLTQLGYKKLEGAGSRVKFIKGDTIIDLHKPHPSPEMKRYAIKDVIEKLKQEGDI